MSLMRELRRRLVPALIPAFGACAIAETKQTLAETTAERRRLERRVALLRADGLDMDMLDEQARSSLGVARTDEIIIYTKPAPTKVN